MRSSIGCIAGHHANGEIVLLNETRADVVLVWIPDQPLELTTDALSGAVALLSLARLAVQLLKLRVVDLMPKRTFYRAASRHREHRLSVGRDCLDGWPNQA